MAYQSGTREVQMKTATALFVSKRLQSAAAALFCLMALQLVAASCSPEPVAYPMGARVAIDR